MIKTMTMRWVCVGIAGVLLGVGVIGEMDRSDKVGKSGVVATPGGEPKPGVVRPAAAASDRRIRVREPNANQDQASFGAP
jgi:hypothetical protein